MREINWRTVSLADLTEDAIGGLWGSPPESTKADETNVLVVRGADFRDWDKRRALDAAPRRIPKRSLGRRTLQRGDLVLEVSGGSPAQPVGRVLVIDELSLSLSSMPLICSNFCRKLQLKPEVDPFFVKRQLDWLYRSGHTDRFQTSTTNIRNLRVNDFLAGTQIVLPKRDVQEHVTALLDKVESKRGSSISHFVAARRAIERFRQAVLDAACTGRLSADWRENHSGIEDAATLVAQLDVARRRRLGRRYKTAIGVDAADAAPDGWTWTTIGALVDVATGATPLRTNSAYYGGTVPWVTSGAVNSGYITKASEYITELALKETNTKVFSAGTLLVAMYGEGQTRGRVAELGIDAATNQAVAALLFDDASDILRPYLRVFFLQHYERIRQLSFGGVQPNLSLSVIRTTPIALPPQEEQLEIVQRVEMLLASADRLAERVHKAQRSTDRTSQAVLARSFRVEPTQTEPA